MNIIPFNKSLLAISVSAALSMSESHALLISPSTYNLEASYESPIGNFTDSDQADGINKTFASVRHASSGVNVGTNQFGLSTDSRASFTDRDPRGRLNTANNSAKALFSESITVTNDEISAINPTFDFTIDAGGLAVFSGINYDNGEYAKSNYSSKILLDNEIIWESQGLLETDSNGTRLDLSGSQLGLGLEQGGFSNQADYYEWSEQTYMLDLGLLNVNESFTIEYMVELVSESILLENFDSLGNYAGPLGSNTRGRFDQSVLELEFTDLAMNNYSDPFNFGSSPTFDASAFSFTPSESTTVTAVNEPSTILLFGAGLAGLAWRRRKNVK